MSGCQLYEIAVPLLESARLDQEPPAVVEHTQAAIRWLSDAVVKLDHDQRETPAALADALGRLLIVRMFAATAPQLGGGPRRAWALPAPRGAQVLPSRHPPRPRLPEHRERPRVRVPVHALLARRRRHLPLPRAAHLLAWCRYLSAFGHRTCQACGPRRRRSQSSTRYRVRLYGALIASPAANPIAENTAGKTIE
jgi:hypothetical protein